MLSRRTAGPAIPGTLITNPTTKVISQPRRSLQEPPEAPSDMVVLGGGAVSYERGTPVQEPPEAPSDVPLAQLRLCYMGAPFSGVSRQASPYALDPAP